MKAHLFGPKSLTLMSMKRCLQDAGYIVLHSTISNRNAAAVAQRLDVVPAADLYVFYAGHEAMRLVKNGLVLLDLRDDFASASAVWVLYADVCVVSDSQVRISLVKNYDCAPERIFVVAENRVLLQILERVLRGGLSPLPAWKETSVSANETPLHSITTQIANCLIALEQQFDVIQRGYQVKSKIPLLGPFVDWLRRNLTSHLREPYVDPSLERQVSFNREFVKILREIFNIQSLIDTMISADLTDTLESVTGIEICDPTIDEKSVLKQLEWKVKQRWAQGAYDSNVMTLGPASLHPDHFFSDSPDIERPSFQRSLEKWRELRHNIHLREPNFHSNVPVAARLIVAVRRFWHWMSTKWYIRPILYQQSVVNMHVAQFVMELLRLHEFDTLRIGQLEARQTELETRISRLEEKLEL